MKLELVTRKDVSYVHIVKEDKTSIGISVKDGKAGFWPIIKRIKAGSLAERSHSVCEGDTLLSINGRNTLSMTRQQVKRLFKEARSSLFELKLEYEMHEATILGCTVYEQKQLSFFLKKEDGTYGFILRKRGLSYPFTVEHPIVSHVEYGGAAYKEGSLMVGDKLLRIDNISLSWLSLQEIALILQQTEKAEFSVEYKVGAINLPKTELNETELKVCIPNVELGITLAFSPAYPPKMSVEHIGKGSLAERSGAFSEGDLILAINGVDASCLTPSKANGLIHAFKKEPGKVLYRSNRWKKETIGRSSCDLLLRNSEMHNELSTKSYSSRDRIEDNFQVSSLALIPTSNSEFRATTMNDLNQDDKVDSIFVFQDIARNIMGLKSTLHQLCSSKSEKSFVKVSASNDLCKCCKNTQIHATVCYPCLTDMNSMCCKAVDSIRSVAINYVDLRATHPKKIVDKCKWPCFNSFQKEDLNRELIRTLASNLPQAFWDRTGLKDRYGVISESILHLNLECKKCTDGITTLSCLIQKLLLMISLNDTSSQIETKIDHLIESFSRVEIPCEDCSESSRSSKEAVLPSMKKSNTFFLFKGEKLTNHAKEPEKLSNEIPQETDRKDVTSPSVLDKISRLGLNLLEESVLFKPGTSNNSADLERSCIGDILNLTYSVENNELSSRGTSRTQNPRGNFPVNENIKLTAKMSTEKIYKDKGLKHISNRSWKSAESVLTSRHVPSGVPKTESSIDVNPGCSRDPYRPAKLQHSSKSCSVEEHENGLSSARTQQSNASIFSTKNHGLKCPSLGLPSLMHNSESQNRVRHEVMNVTLIDEHNEGFGIGLGFISTDSTIPVITFIKPKSVAKRIGILSVHDRVIAINDRSIVGVTQRDLEAVREELVPLKRVTLTVEFDVNVRCAKFGIFNVHLSRNLIPGLLYEDASMRRGAPMRLKGIVKGSASHRSGEVFVGDEILFIQCQREEDFDPISFDYSRYESILITLRRKQTKEENPPTVEPSSGASLQDPVSGVLRQGASYRVTGTCVRLLDTQTVVEIRVRLFRDPKNWDFGFLVGERPGTGLAYVTDVREGGPAHDSGVVKKLDRIVEVDGVAIGSNNDVSILTLLTRANEKVDLLLRRIHRAGAAGPSGSSYPID